MPPIQSSGAGGGGCGFLGAAIDMKHSPSRFGQDNGSTANSWAARPHFLYHSGRSLPGPTKPIKEKDGKGDDQAQKAGPSEEDPEDSGLWLSEYQSAGDNRWFAILK